MPDSPMTAPAAMPEIERIIRRHLDWPAERDRDGAISAAMHDIVRDVQDLFAPILAEKERLASLVGVLQDDIAKLADTHEQCEGCKAPIADDEDACTASDVRGCWGYAADVKGAPCWRYRTREGVDRAWPECKPLAAIRAGE